MRAALEAFGDQIKAQNPRSRIGTPQDIAGVAIFLASRAGAYTIRAVVPCDGDIITTI
jgi:NAD(P)-dependent dehydrogenase (short-subunit alcohol dehydrogenase family)